MAGYSWEKLPEGSLVVDVGGGVGAQSLTLATHHPHLRFVVQDLKHTVDDAVTVCGLDLPICPEYPPMCLTISATVLEDEHVRRA
jgi:O-methyltransferase domain